ncbi:MULTISPECIES: LLM class flavin-dependent oxidoreductase [unclassified Mycobacterium]|uniref:LLM class flavin-dependent oxidoreductase n=1 Tax=unclassified Mycobacterium TaxID=2642494 RepID=UPI0012E9C6AB|nr:MULTISPECIES: LLM class flavin-dependent oxidoreductase [unclassified Mycobacterium]
MMEPKQYAERLDAVRAAVSDHGRDPMAITPAVWLPVITGRSRDDIDEVLESTKACAPNARAELCAESGAPHPLVPTFSGSQDLLPFTMDEDSALSLVADVPRSVLRAACLDGTPAEVIDRAAEGRDHGVRVHRDYQHQHLAAEPAKRPCLSTALRRDHARTQEIVKRGISTLPVLKMARHAIARAHMAGHGGYGSAAPTQSQ